MSLITIYKESTGEILRACDVPEGREWLQCGQGEAWIDGKHRGSTHYVVDGKPVAKLLLPPPSKFQIVAALEDAAIWTDLPNPTSVYVDGELVDECTDGVFEFDAVHVGKYQIRLVPPITHMEQRSTIDAV